MNRRIALFGLSALAVAAMISLIDPPRLLAQARAALVRDIDHPAKQPVRISGSFLLTADQDNNVLFICPLGAACTTSVPPGKRLVIESMSLRVSIAAGDTFNVISLNGYVLPVALQQTFPGGARYLAGAHMMRLCVDGSVNLTINRPEHMGSGSIGASGTGYFVDLN